MQHVGIDFSSGVELAQHTEALGPDGGSGSARTEPPADAEAGLPSFTDTAFFLYYDEVAEKYDMRDPLVVAPDGSEVECSKPSSLERGVRYFCVVTLKDGGYAADVLSESEAEGKDPGGYDALWKVHLFNVPKEGEEDYGDEEPGHEDGMQYHTGAVVVGGGGGGGGDSELPEPFLYGEYTTEGDEPTHYDHYVRTDGVYGGFLLDGEGKTVSGSGVSVADGDTSVWLVGVGKPKNADDSDWHRGSGGSDEEPDHYEWEFELKKNYSLGQSGAHADDKVVELQLYAFSHCEVTCDYRGQFLPATSGAPVTSSVDDLGPFPPVYGAPQGGLSRIGAGYVQVGGFTIEVAGADVASPTTVVAVDVTVGSGGAPSGVLKQYTSWSGLTGDQTDLNHVYIPIYKLKWDEGDPPKGAVEMDLRRMPMTGMLETFLASSSSGSGSGGSGS